MITEILNNPRSEVFFSFLIGLGVVVMLFHRPVHSVRSLALEPSNFENRNVKADGKCYKYRVEDASCELPSSK
jgi:hypothetical protein